MVNPKLVLDFESKKVVKWGEGTAVQGSILFVENGFYDVIFTDQPDDQTVVFELIQHYFNAIIEEAYQWHMNSIAYPDGKDIVVFAVNSAAGASILKCFNL